MTGKLGLVGGTVYSLLPDANQLGGKAIDRGKGDDGKPIVKIELIKLVSVEPVDGAVE